MFDYFSLSIKPFDHIPVTVILCTFFVTIHENVKSMEFYTANALLWSASEWFWPNRGAWWWSGKCSVVVSPVSYEWQTELWSVELLLFLVLVYLTPPSWLFYWLKWPDFARCGGWVYFVTGLCGFVPHSESKMLLSMLIHLANCRNLVIYLYPLLSLNVLITSCFSNLNSFE